MTPEAVHAFFSSARNVKRFTTHCDYRLLQSLNESFSEALDAKKAAHEKSERQRIEREEKRCELLALITGEGFSPEELIGGKALPGRARRTMKYSYSDNGKIRQWSGVGKTPRTIRDALNNGTPLESFLIEKQEFSNDNR
ncbi:hypothetical protein NG99_24430 [Erwinia typographi]|uniref:DNA-binding protein H-NS-like C-terminal domain-containing protein n=1 Tax=Erwinia typographi TaxID=371042 RepID=A0A0A3YNH3_9GAMM|nr:hypothetical protein NG99_24430 [Erwinia typographi]